MSRKRSSSSSVAEEGDSVPEPLPGYNSFRPTDEELASFYLKKKIQGRDSSFRHLIPEIDLYKHDPCDLPATFFARLDHKSTNSDSYKRATEEGFYKKQGKELKIKAESTKAVIGTKAYFTFYRGRGLTAKKTDTVIHVYWSTKSEQGSNPNQQRDIVLCCRKNKASAYKSDSKKPKHTSISNEFADPSNGGYIAFNSENQGAAAAASNRMITDTEEFQAYKELENAVLGSDNHGGGLAGSGSPSEFDDQAVDDMIQEYLLHDHPLPEPPQPPELGNVLDVSNDECSNRQSASNHMITYTEEVLAYKELENAVLGCDNHDACLAGGGSPSEFDDQAVDDMIQEYLLRDHPPPKPPQLENVPDVSNDSYLISKNNSSTDYGKVPVSTIANEALDEKISEEEENLESRLHPSLLQNCALQPPFSYWKELGNILHDNNYIVCNGSEFLHTEIPAFFPQRS